MTYKFENLPDGISFTERPFGFRFSLDNFWVDIPAPLKQENLKPAIGLLLDKRLYNKYGDDLISLPRKMADALIQRREPDENLVKMWQDRKDAMAAARAVSLIES